MEGKLDHIDQVEFDGFRKHNNGENFDGTGTLLY